MIGERLAEVRKMSGDTQRCLAQRLHVTVSAVRCWEQEKSSPNHETLVAICKLYKVSSDYLLGLSNVDPQYEKRLVSRLTEEHLAELKRYENYLLWLQRQGGKA